MRRFSELNGDGRDMRLPRRSITGASMAPLASAPILDARYRRRRIRTAHFAPSSRRLGATAACADDLLATAVISSLAMVATRSRWHSALAPSLGDSRPAALGRLRPRAGASQVGCSAPALGVWRGDR